MLSLEAFVGEPLHQSLARSIVTTRETGTAVQLKFDGTRFIVTAGMSVMQAAAAWRRAHHGNLPTLSRSDCRREPDVSWRPSA